MGPIATTEQSESFPFTKRKKPKRKIQLSKLASRRESTCKMTSTSSSCLFVIVIVFAAFALTTGKAAVKNEDLAEQLKEARHESAELRQRSEELHQKSEELHKELEKSKEEMKNVVLEENKKLRSEDSKLKREADKLKAEAAKLRKENKKLRRQDEELRQRDAELERKVNEVKKALRQRDENNTLELQNVVRNSFRQMDFTSELKKTINNQIKEYLDDNKLCVSGQLRRSIRSSAYISEGRKIEFGQTFQRIPAFAAALNYVSLKTSDSYAYAQVYDFRVTNSSAVVRINTDRCYGFELSWIACL